MIGIIVSVFTGIKELASILPHKRRQFFQDKVEPIFQHMTQIHRDYTTTFNNFYILVRDKNIPSQELMDMVGQRRSEYWHIRELAKDLVADIGQRHFAKKKKVWSLFNKKFKTEQHKEEFIVAVYSYFLKGCDLDKLEGISWYSDFMNTLGLYTTRDHPPWDRANQFSEWRPYILKTLEEISNKLLPEAWTKVSKPYTKLRKICL